jgi:hypothetical protein
MDSGMLQLAIGKHCGVPFFPIQIRDSKLKNLPQGQQKFETKSLIFFKVINVTKDNCVQFQVFDVKSQQLSRDMPAYPIHIKDDAKSIGQQEPLKANYWMTGWDILDATSAIIGSRRMIIPPLGRDQISNTVQNSSPGLHGALANVDVARQRGIH